MTDSNSDLKSFIDLERVLEKVPEPVRDFIREEIEARDIEADRISNEILTGVRETFSPEEMESLTDEQKENLKFNLDSLREVLRDVFFAGCSWQGRRVLASLQSKMVKPEEVN